MSNKLKSVTVGVVSLFAIGVLYWGIHYLKGVNVMNDKRVLHVYYQDIAGLTEGNSITLKGHKIGTVTKISFDDKRDNQLKVLINIEDDVQIPVNSKAKIISLDLLGTKGISLILGDTNVMAISGSELESAMEASLQDEVNAQILPLKNKTEGLISSIDSVMIVITSVFNKDARESLNKSLTGLDRTFNTLSNTMLTVNSIVKGNEENLNEIILNFKTISTSFSESNTEIKNILYNFSSFSDSLAKADILSTLNNIDEITKQINNNEGSLGLLINDKKLYNNLQKASKELEQLLGDVKDNPGRYVSFSVIGAKNKPFTEKKTE